MIWFLGVSHRTVDEKQRVAIPSRLREQIAGSGSAALYTVALRDHILVLPEESWETFVSRLLREENPKEFELQYKFLRRQVGIFGEICKLDSQGRIALRKDQLKRAGIGRDIVVYGNLGRIELWPKSEFEKIDAEARSQNVDNLWSELMRTL